MLHGDEDRLYFMIIVVPNMPVFAIILFSVTMHYDEDDDKGITWICLPVHDVDMYAGGETMEKAVSYNQF